MAQSIRPLGDYLDLLEQRGLLVSRPAGLDPTAPVALVSYDSRQVVPGTLFVCKGAHFKAEFLQMARDKGAMAYVSLEPYPQVDLPCIQVTDMRETIAPLADLYYGHPSGDLNVIGITGTKGKSSTPYYLKYILDEYLAGEGRPAPQGRRPERQRSRAAGDYMRGASSLSRAHRALVPRSLLRSSSMVMRRLFSRVSSMSFLISARTGVWYSSTAFS